MECSSQILPNLDTRNAFLAILPQESFREYLMGRFLYSTAVACLSASSLFFALSLHKLNHSEMCCFSSILPNKHKKPSERCHPHPTRPLSLGHDLSNRFQSSVMSCSTRCIYKHSCSTGACYFCPLTVYGKTSTVQVCQRNKCTSV